ncbi:hypothetical protein [Acidovorax sp. Leaf78]|uniref:hypothetical protein n=1 Tax=Acidovorax sp. Leaf78 TaxID=1736237 RepID=UPI000A9656C8|nr:hypothetical protein [Acidovorax sp. Leaf78]
MPAKLTMPTLGGLTNPKFRYVDRDHTNIAETFKRARRALARAQQEAQSAQQTLELEPERATVVTLPQRAGRRSA